MTDLIFCSECSRNVGEQVYGTAPRTHVWLLLEYTAEWGAYAVADSQLPEAVKARLKSWSEAIPYNKTLFIRQPQRTARQPVFYVALSREVNPVLYRFELSAYEDLLEFDLDAVLREDERYQPMRWDQPIYAVCVNGRRDIACSKYGMPVYQALAEQLGNHVWQCSHVGGHRFAGTFAILPRALMYGYTDADSAIEIYTAFQQGQVMVSSMRGHAYYDAPAQAAEYYLRGITGNTNLSGWCLEKITPTGDQAWEVTFSVDGQPHTVRLTRQLSEWETYESSTDDKPRQMLQFHLQMG